VNKAQRRKTLHSIVEIINGILKRTSEPWGINVVRELGTHDTSSDWITVL
jgi:hypothetical protein